MLVNNLGVIKIVLIYGSTILEYIQAKFRNIREIKQLFHIEKQIKFLFSTPETVIVNFE